MKSQKVLFFCCLLGSQLLAMEQKPQALTVKKSGELGALADANSSHWGFWGKTGAAVGAAGGLATLGIGAGLFFAPKEDRDLGYKDRITKVLARIGALLPFGARRHSRAEKSAVGVTLEGSESPLAATDGLMGGGETASAATSVRQNADSQSKAAAEMTSAIGWSVLLSFCDEDFSHSIERYQQFLSKVMSREVKKEEVLGLLEQCLDIALSDIGQSSLPAGIDSQCAWGIHDALTLQCKALARMARDPEWAAQINPLCDPLCRAYAAYREMKSRHFSMYSYEKIFGCSEEKIVIERLEKLVVQLAEIKSSAQFEDVCAATGVLSFRVKEMVDDFEYNLGRLKYLAAKNSSAVPDAESKKE